VLQFHLLVLHLPSVALSVFNTHFFEGVVVTSIVVKFFIEIMDDLIASNVKELSGVGDDDNSALAVAYVVLQPHDGI
jgi:hypothetical protein